MNEEVSVPEGPFQKVITSHQPFEERRAYNSSGQVEYIGEATPGSEDSVAVWRIHKRVYSSNRLTKISWADYDAEFDKIWDDRATYNYR